MKTNFLPISINIADKKILIIGGGKNALNKLKILQRFNAHVNILAIEVCKEIKERGVVFKEEPYHKKHLKGYFMVYSCINNTDTDKQIIKDGTEAGVLVNIHDKPDLCQFVSPAIYKKGNMTVAVGSNGENVYESIRVRDEIKDFLENR